MSARFFDTHCHIQGSEFDADRDAVIERARNAGLVGMLVLGVDLESSEAAIALAEANDGVYAAAGCHPHDAGKMDDVSLTKLAELAARPSVVAVGEIGLDFYRNLSAREQQIEVLERQLQTAADVSKPVAVHGREAHETLFPIIESWSRRLGGALADGRPLGVMHYFSGDAELGQHYVELGLMISVHTSVTYPKNERLHDVAAKLPLEALVVETDSPYGSPQSQRGKRNEPASVAEAASKIAELRGESIERVAEVTTENALCLFGLAGSASMMSQAKASRGA